MAVAIVVGAARGIGAAVAVRLAEQGWDLALGDVCEDDAELAYPLGSSTELEGVAVKCRNSGITVGVAKCDVRVLSEMEALTAQARTLGEVHAVVYVAGVLGGSGLAWEVDDATFERDLDVNFRGLVNAARATVPTLLSNAPNSRFVAVLSASSHSGLPLLSSYAASKHAAAGYLHSLAIDLAAHGVTVNGVSPGSTDTRLLQATAAVYDLKNVSEFAEQQRIGRLLDPAEIASAVSWLVSPEASGVTGSVVRVDGIFTG